jgi:hypothetical protein
MKIYIESKTKLSNEHKNIIKLLELDSDFEKMVWKARGILGVKPEELEVKTKLTSEIKALYLDALSKRPQKPTFQQLNDYFDYLDESGKKDFGELKRLANNPKDAEKFDLMDKKAGEFFHLLHYQASQVMNQYASLPRSWEHTIEWFLVSGKLYLNDIEPIVLHFDASTVRNLKKIPYPSEEDNKQYYKNPAGIKITLTGKVSRNTFDRWLDKHWKKIETLMERVKLPDTWEPDIQSIDSDIKLMKKAKKKTYGAISDKLTKDSTNAKSSYYDETYYAKKVYRLKKYILRLKTGQKVP